MLSYNFIEDTFKAVLMKSKAIQGRFHFAPKGGAEINADLLNEVLQEYVNGQTGSNGPKYPLALCMPPRSTVDDLGVAKDGWDNYLIDMFFLKQSFVTSGNQVQSVNEDTRTSTHTIPQDWHDMKRCAVGFFRVMKQLSKPPTIGFMQVIQKTASITPVSNIGVDRCAGVRMQFGLSIYIGCDLEDYEADDVKTISITNTDSHPRHNL